MCQFNQKIILAAVLLGSSIVAAAVIVDPKEYFALSQQFHGDQTLFLSHQACSVSVKGIDQALLDRFEMTAMKQKTERWSKATLHTRYGNFHACWAPIRKGAQDGIIACQVGDDKVSDQCTVLAKTFFIDTSSLPPEPKKAHFN